MAARLVRMAAMQADSPKSEKNATMLDDCPEGPETWFSLCTVHGPAETKLCVRNLAGRAQSFRGIGTLSRPL